MAGLPPHPTERTPLALRFIILEKLVKSTVVLAAAAAFGVMLLTGSSVHLHGLATHLREHVSSAWSVALADAVVSVTERRHLTVATCALALDGVVTGLEWYALRRGRVWGEWLVVVAMSALLPFEIASLARQPKLGRVVILVLNVAIVAYLAWYARRRARPTPSG